MKRPMGFLNKPTITTVKYTDDDEMSSEMEKDDAVKYGAVPTVSRQESGEELDEDEPAETQVEPERQMVKDFVDSLNSKQFGYLQECIARRVQGELKDDESKGPDADKSPEFRFDEISEENDSLPKTVRSA